MASNSPERTELDRVLNALALELPPSVHTDASRRIRDLFDAALDQQRRQQDERWKVAINRQAQPTLCDGSDQINPLSPEDTIAVVHAHIVSIEQAYVGIVQRRIAEERQQQRAETIAKLDDMETQIEQWRNDETAGYDAAIAVLCRVSMTLHQWMVSLDAAVPLVRGRTAMASEKPAAIPPEAQARVQDFVVQHLGWSADDAAIPVLAEFVCAERQQQQAEMQVLVRSMHVMIGGGTDGEDLHHWQGFNEAIEEVLAALDAAVPLVRGRRSMIDPTYVRAEIEANPVWRLAFRLSELHNDNAPIGWSRYLAMAEWLLRNYDMTEKAVPGAQEDNDGEYQAG